MILYLQLLACTFSQFYRDNGVPKRFQLGHELLVGQIVERWNMYRYRLGITAYS